MAPEVIKALTGKARLERLLGAVEQAEAQLDEARQFAMTYAPQPPHIIGYLLPTREELMAQIKQFESCLAGFNKKIIEHRAELLSHEWKY